MPDNVKLLPCPFCGGSDIHSSHIRDGRQITCRDCGASIFAYQPNAEAEARMKWNRRTLPSLEELERGLEGGGTKQ